jgi:hypothetical protein
LARANIGTRSLCGKPSGKCIALLIFSQGIK